MKQRLLLILSFIILFSCKTSVSNETEVYNNDFESSNLSSITNATTTKINNNTILGNYNNGGFQLNLNNLTEHELVTISFDLYIHDSWDGNAASPEGPDLWQMMIDGENYISTTFSNEECPAGSFCTPQSYPKEYPNNNNNPKAGAYRTDLPGLCLWKNKPNGTTMYKISKTFKHTSSALSLKCLDKLAHNSNASGICDESWSVDNISVKTIAL
jgi:hypothetical protein